MIRQYRFLTPFPTGAVEDRSMIENCIEMSSFEKQELEKAKGFPFQISFENNKAVLKRKMQADDKIYGLGEQARGINKRGFSYISNCSDDCHHHENKHSLYGAHNFFILSGVETFGIFVDSPEKVCFDCGYTKQDELVITIPDGNADIYVVESAEKKQEKDIVMQFRKLIGKSYLPPYWAFGFQQSRWGYRNEADILEVAEEYKKAGIGLDAIYMDIDYMDQYMDFTVDPERFPDLKRLSSDLKKEGIHLVPIIDAGVKILDGYSVYEEGKENNYFCKNEKGEDFVTAVWPGQVHFPDVMNAKAREWFGNYYHVLTDLGIDGFWNDMNEPAMFYTLEGISEYTKLVKSLEGKNLGIGEVFHMRGMAEGLANREEDYRRFYHRVDGIDEKTGTELAKIDGYSYENGILTVRHDKIHNLFGYNMTKAAGEALKELCKEEPALLFSRASYIGMHRYGGIWTGDNASRFDHLKMNISQMPGLSMCGFLYSGADMGGFGEDATQELMTRWVQFSMFTPLMRNHACDGSRRQELYQFDNKETLRKLINIRYALVPYLYEQFVKARENGTMLFAPLAFEFPEDEMACEVSDQLMFGEDLMLVPVYTEHAKGRYVYLPERMMEVRMTDAEEYQARVVEAGHHYLPYSQEEVVFFVRDGHEVVLGNAAKNTTQAGREKAVIRYEKEL